MKQYFVGIDIGSTASKVVVLEENKVADAFVLPTGWNGRETARQIPRVTRTVIGVRRTKRRVREAIPTR